MTSWKVNHRKAIDKFLFHLNESSNDYILKGGTALLACYELDRFSEDIDLDGFNSNIKDIVEEFCLNNGYSFRTAKDTATVKRYMINYGNAERPLKVEVSYRNKFAEKKDVNIINGIMVYSIDALCAMKTNAYLSRDRIRDLYDLSFICGKYYDSLDSRTITTLRDAIGYKGIEQFDYVIKEQKDEFINESKLAADFLSMYDKLGLLYDPDDKKKKSSLIKSASTRRNLTEAITTATGKAAKANAYNNDSKDKKLGVNKENER
ncbi:MAG: nucleotidyl transferase AbiEii/AbiGii toxin family protein [Clostridia bacterium]|nr:nucleotidyl transferase AbiEii/AbiGii toxin family protein [Clostridia bacterium]